MRMPVIKGQEGTANRPPEWCLCVNSLSTEFVSMISHPDYRELLSGKISS